MAPQGRALTLPIVAWEGLIDALAAARKCKQRSERNMPARTGARWSETETAELAKTFKSGASIGQLARIHNRTQYAIEAQLERLGLWDRAARQPMGRVATGDFGELAHADSGRPSPEETGEESRSPGAGSEARPASTAARVVDPRRSNDARIDMSGRPRGEDDARPSIRTTSGQSYR
jgi:hypothetical protein